MKTNRVCEALILSTALALIGCSKTKLDTGNAINPDVMSGVAATGAPISGGLVEIKGKNGTIVEKTTSSDGSYSANVAELEEPYLVRVIAPNGEKYISVASKSALADGKKINVTPLTHTIVAGVFENSDADEVFADFENEAAKYSDIKLEEKKQELLQIFISAGLIGNEGVVGSNIDLLNGELKAGTSIGVDGLLDVIQVKNTSATSIEIKVKGSSNAIVKSVDPAVNSVGSISASDVSAASAQLSVIALLRTRMNALAALYSSKVVCNGSPVDNNSACDVDNLYNAFLPYFHSAFQEDGYNRAKSVWGWICRTEDDEDVYSKQECMDNGRIRFERVELKDISLISFDPAPNNVALINFNLYVDGHLEGSEEMSLKLESGVYKLLGNKKSFKYWISTQSMYETNYTKSNASRVDSYSVDLNFYYKNSGAHTFDGDEVLKLTAASGHAIFPGNSSTMNLYLVPGPQYDKDGNCSAGVVFSTTPTPYKNYSFSDGTTTHLSYQDACVDDTDPCKCQKDNESWTHYDWDVAQKVTLTKAQVALMDRTEKINLLGFEGDIEEFTDTFLINKPLVINEFNAAKYVPSIGRTVASFCNDFTFNSTLNVSLPSDSPASLDHISLHVGFSNSSSSSWNNDSDHYSFNSGAKTAAYTPAFTKNSTGDIIRSTHLWLSSEDEFDRKFVRRINCHESSF